MPPGTATFTFAGESTLNGERVQIFDFKVTKQKSQWILWIGKKTFTAAYRGRLFVTKNGHVRRLEQKTEYDTGHTYYSASLQIDYDDVKLGDRGPYTLPKNAVAVLCPGAGSFCHRNEIAWDNYRKFTVNSTVLPVEDSPTPP